MVTKFRSSLHKYLLAGEQAVNYTRSKIKWSGNRPIDIALSMGASTYYVSEMRDFEDKLLRKMLLQLGERHISHIPPETRKLVHDYLTHMPFRFSEKQIYNILTDVAGRKFITPLMCIWLRATAAESWHVGNCGEHAAVAFMWLYRNRPDVRPIDYCYRPSGDHGYVAIGSRIKPSEYNFKEWWDNAVICDPYRKFTFSARAAFLYRYNSDSVDSWCHIEDTEDRTKEFVRIITGS